VGYRDGHHHWSRPIPWQNKSWLAIAIAHYNKLQKLIYFLFPCVCRILCRLVVSCCIICCLLVNVNSLTAWIGCPCHIWSSQYFCGALWWHLVISFSPLVNFDLAGISLVLLLAPLAFKFLRQWHLWDSSLGMLWICDVQHLTLSRDSSLSRGSLRVCTAVL